jgi:hypothetical protein
VAARNTPDEKPWAVWLRNQLRERDLQAKDITERSGGQVGSYALSRWLDSKRDPDVESIRKVCAALGVPIAEGLLGAQVLAVDEIGATVVQRLNPADLTKGELIAELTRRIPDDAASGEHLTPPTSINSRRDQPLLIPEGEEGKGWVAWDPES